VSHGEASPGWVRRLRLRRNWCSLALALPVHPELDRLQGHLSALIPYRVAADVMLCLLPVDAGKSPETLAAIRYSSASGSPM
jgi:hypothetical protein